MPNGEKYSAWADMLKKEDTRPRPRQLGRYPVADFMLGEFSPNVLPKIARVGDSFKAFTRFNKFLDPYDMVPNDFTKYLNQMELANELQRLKVFGGEKGKEALKMFNKLSKTPID